MSTTQTRRHFLARVGSVVTAFAVPQVWIRHAAAEYVSQPWETHPLRCIGKVFVNLGQKNGCSGTGALVGPRVVLTSAHLLYDRKPEERGAYPPSVSFTPSYNKIRKMRSFPISRFFLCPGWKEEVDKGDAQDYNKSVSCDLAVLVLNAAPRTGHMGLCSDENSIPSVVQHAGYPGISNGVLFQHELDVSVNGNILFARGLKHELYAGMSGSPLYFFSNGDHYICGVHANSNNEQSSHPRITSDLVKFIKKLDEQYPS